MMADNIEHVISYWVIFQKFHSPTLGGFAVVSHWLPFLLFSVYSGALADRFDTRRIIQLGMVLFMCVSFAWGLLFVTDSVRIWHAVVLLSVHGVAGVLWSPASQLIIHDIVGPAQLPSAVRLNATVRYAGMLIGPALGGALLLLFGPSAGIALNALIYLPMIVFLWKAPYGLKARVAESAPRTLRGFGELRAAFREVAANPVLTSVSLLAACVSFLVGNSYQAQMPGFAAHLGHGNPGVAYSMLLAADAGGALLAGLALETHGLLVPRVKTAMLLAMLWCCALITFASTSLYPLALSALFVAGFFELSFSSMAQTLLQLNATPGLRGRAIGVYSMGALGMRTFSGFSVGFAGALLGIHHSLALSAALVLLIVIALLGFYVRRTSRAAAPA